MGTMLLWPHWCGLVVSAQPHRFKMSVMVEPRHETRPEPWEPSLAVAKLVEPWEPSREAAHACVGRAALSYHGNVRGVGIISSRDSVLSV